MNPLRFKPAPYAFKDIVLLVVTHLPESDNTGYHNKRMEVVQTCLNSMRSRADRESTMMVWDNESSPTFREWLLNEFNPDVAILSKNIGKNQARAAAIRMLPLGSIVAYSDDDFYYENNWLSPQIKILNHFQAQLVTGYPCRMMFGWGCEQTVAWANKHGKVEQGRFIPEQWERDYAISIGRDPDLHINEVSKGYEDIKVKYNGSEAYCHGHHAQFIGYVAKLLPGLATTNDGLAMSDEKVFDISMGKLGLRLATTERLARHIGNVIHDELRQEIMQGAIA